MAGASSFSPQKEAERLNRALNCHNVDCETIIEVLSCRLSNQRADIAKAFKEAFSKELKDELKCKLLIGNFRKVCKALCYTLSDFDAKCLRKAMKGAGTDEETLIDILTTRNNKQLRDIQASYMKFYKTDLAEDIKSESSGNFRRVLISILTASRDESANVSASAVAQDVDALYKAGEKKIGTDESTFNHILCTRSFMHIAAIVKEYARRHGKNLSNVISSETSGNYAKVLRSIVSYAVNPAGHIAEVFYKSMKGIGTNDRRLQRTVISYCKSDIAAVKAAYQRLHSKSLADTVRGDTSGDYRKILLALIGEH